MASLNKVMIIGNLGKDPEVRHTASGTAVATFSIATSERFKNKQTNEWEKKTEWHNIVLWDKQATLAGQYLTKGSTIYLEGRLQTRKWQDKNGTDRYTTEIVGSSLEFLSTKGEGSRSGGGDAGNESTGSSFNEEPPFQDDDIPF
jgi:single-strand DNA-binding protein